MTWMILNRSVFPSVNHFAWFRNYAERRLFAHQWQHLCKPLEHNAAFCIDYSCDLSAAQLFSLHRVVEMSSHYVAVGFADHNIRLYEFASGALVLTLQGLLPIFQSFSFIRGQDTNMPPG